MNLVQEKVFVANVSVTIEQVTKLQDACFHPRWKRRMTVHWQGWPVVINKMKTLLWAGEYPLPIKLTENKRRRQKRKKPSNPLLSRL